MDDQQSPPKADGEQHTTTGVNTAKNKSINATNNAGIQRRLESKALLTALLSPQDGNAYQAYAETCIGGELTEWFDELSILEHPVIARLLLDASSGALFLSTEG